MVRACPIAACCTGDDCLVTTELACDEAGGNWLIGTTDCGTDPNCTLPPLETDNECCKGACCLGPGECEDEVTAGVPMTEPDCEGTYIGGAACDDDPFPCPVCPIESEENCQETARATVYIADTHAVEDMRRADDFIAKTETISGVCVTGTWIDDETPCSIDGIANRCDCACVDDDQVNCLPVETDGFTVCVYEDAGLNPGGSSMPVESPVGCSSATMMRVNDLPDEGWNFDEWTISLALDSGIGLLTLDGVYWLEVSNYTAPGAYYPEIDCNWRWARDGNLVSTPADPEDPSGNDWHMFDFNSLWEGTDGESTDMAFCLDQRIEPPPVPPLGACCLCDPLGDCIDGTTLGECDDMLGAWKIGEVCATPDLCPQTRPMNDDCTTYMQEVFDGLEAFNNLCATADGPRQIQCEGDDPTDIGADVWFKYKATCSGLLTISMCDDADFDSALAVYTDGSTTAAVCPTDDTYLVLCGDDTCGIGAGPPEVVVPEPTIGVWYTLQFAGWDDEYSPPVAPECVEGCQGSGSFTIECEGLGDCPLSSAPRSDPVPDPEDIGHGTKNRYMTFAGGDAGVQQAVRVKFMSLPGYEYAEGRTAWVQDPFVVTEASGADGEVPPPAHLAAQLDCDPVCRDWSRGTCIEGVCTDGPLGDMRAPCTHDDECRRVDVYGPDIVPRGLYNVQFIDCDENCLITKEENYSDPLPVLMSRAGDVCGAASFNAPEDDVNFVDISAVVAKFKNDPGSMRKARADIVGNGPNDALVNRKGDFVDITCVVAAFRGEPCELPGPLPADPCPGP